ncbi:MAG: alpha-amylase, partial [Planctomycetes bacterium]|nr:alpha-amylase [Planctomycetota bacterium]
MISVCLYFQVHQPHRLKKYSIFDVHAHDNYFDTEKNKNILLKVAHKCYLPTNKILLALLKKFPQFKVSFSFSGTVLEQFELFCPEVLESFQQLVDTGRVEILAETYHHSLAFIYSQQEFIDQVVLHRKKIKKLFNFKPTILRNTDLIYNNDLA